MRVKDALLLLLEFHHEKDPENIHIDALIGSLKYLDRVIKECNSEGLIEHAEVAKSIQEKLAVQIGYYLFTGSANV